MSTSPLLEQLIDALRVLPGVGPKSAQRMAYYLLERNRDGAQSLARILQQAIAEIGHCEQCRTLTEHSVCSICSHSGRDRSRLCLVENPADVTMIERATDYRGVYFVLMGHLSPLDGIGPEELGLDRLAGRLDQGEVEEVIIATNPTVEGEATAHYIGEMARKRHIRATRLAHGVPLGGELEYVDSGTLSHAFTDRREV